MTSAELQRTDLGAAANRDSPAALRALLADVFALYVKTKNFHWHMSGSHFRDYHLLVSATKEGCHSEPSSMRTIVQYERLSGS